MIRFASQFHCNPRATIESTRAICQSRTMILHITNAQKLTLCKSLKPPTIREMTASSLFVCLSPNASWTVFNQCGASAPALQASFKAGLLTRPRRWIVSRLPGIDAVYSRYRCPVAMCETDDFSGGTYSSGYCSGFAPDSLFIPSALRPSGKPYASFSTTNLRILPHISKTIMKKVPTLCTRIGTAVSCSRPFCRPSGLKLSRVVLPSAPHASLALKSCFTISPSSRLQLR